MKNIHLLYTDKPSRLFYLASNLHLEEGQLISPKNYQHIYITSDEEIKYGDWCLDLMNNTIYVATKVVVHNLKSLEYEQYLKKIILTTDQDLIKDGVQAIDDEFLEWFVKNPSFESVEVEKTQYNPVFDEDDFSYDGMTAYYNYKIIIPKEEAKQEKFEHIPYKGNVWEPPVQETLEDLVNKMKILDDKVDLFGYSLGLKDGAKWQQERSYSEEEVIKILYQFHYDLINSNFDTKEEWFEQFKNK